MNVSLLFHSTRMAWQAPQYRIWQAFGEKSIWSCDLHGQIDCAQLLTRWAGEVLFGHEEAKNKNLQKKAGITLLLLRDTHGVMIEVSKETAIFYGESRSLVEQSRKDFQEKFVRFAHGQAEFFIITLQDRQPAFRSVPISRTHVRRPADLDLHYGEGFAAWSRSFEKLLRKGRSGISILQGPPGNGKTSYLRYLMNRLQKTNQFVYIPQGSFGLVTDMNFAELWLDGMIHEQLRIVLVLEDAEHLIMRRNGGGADAGIANLLNVADGLMGDYLRLHVICTANCRMEELDAAVLRPGRLCAYREFRALQPDEAARLAQAKKLPEPASGRSRTLAEMFSAPSDSLVQVPTKRSLGFEN